MSTRDKRGQVFLPGFLTAVWHTPIVTEGELPGGGLLFAECTRASEVAEQATLLDLQPTFAPQDDADPAPAPAPEPDYAARLKHLERRCRVCGGLLTYRHADLVHKACARKERG